MEMEPVILEDTVVSCSYLPGQVFRSENFLHPGITAEQLDILLASGYRHFGFYFFRPFCRKCRQCIPLRVPVDTFKSGASFRRIVNRGKDISVTLEKSSPSEEAFLLYKKHKKKFKDQSFGDYETFLSSFFHLFDFSYQLIMRRDGKLLGIAHLDITNSSLSSIYCYYDTDYRTESLGTLAVLKSLEVARARAIPYMYLGYYIENCTHMNYKIRFRPNQALIEERKWVDFTGPGIDTAPPAIVSHGFKPKKRFSLPFDE